MAKKTKKGTTNPSYESLNMRNAAIDRFRTPIAPKDTIHVTGYTNNGIPYKMFSRKGSPNEKMQKQMGGIPNSVRPVSYDKAQDDPFYVGNYNYVKKPKK